MNPSIVFNRSLPNPARMLSRKGKHRFRIGFCSRILVAAAMFWVSMQLALVPRGQGRSSVLEWRTSGTSINNNHKSSSLFYLLLNARILYVHIGKTGGEWIKSQLAVVCKTRKNPQVKQACLDSFQHENNKEKRQTQIQTQTQLSKQTIGYFHVHNLYPRNAHALATHYLFSVRHPLTRLISWYVYNHPQSCDPREANSPSCKQSAWKEDFFKTCFPTITDLGMSPALLLDPSITSSDNSNNISTISIITNNSTDCAKVLWNGWYGRDSINVKQPNHLYWNYQFYWNQTLAQSPHKSTLVIRQEHLQADIDDLEQQLLFLQQSTGNGGKSVKDDSWFSSLLARKQQQKPASKSVPVPPPQWRLQSDSTHFVTGRVSSSCKTEHAKTIQNNLCCALRHELQIYLDIVKRAINLSAEEKFKTMQTAYEICGIEQPQQLSWNELECRPTSDSLV